MKAVLQKIIAMSGYSSRRQAEELIRNGLVSLNGQLAFLGDSADPQKDIIEINGKTIASLPQPIYIKFNKPLGYVCTNRYFKNEKNIFDLVDINERLFVVGRLDKDSRGLLLLTNDGDLTQKLCHPKFEHEKVYEVKVAGEIANPNAIINKLKTGIDIGEGDGLVKAKEAKYLQNGIFIITLSEGKKRQIRRMLGWLNLNVIDLKRISLASLRLGNLKEGAWEELTSEELKMIKEI